MNRREFLRSASAAGVLAGPYQRLASALQKKVKITDVKIMIVRGTWDWNLIKIETDSGEFMGYAYVTPFDKVHHMALVHGRIGDGTDVPTRLHRANVIQDMFGGAKSVNAALARFKQAGRGVIVVLRDGTAGVPVQALPQEESAAEAARTRQWREVGLGAQILKDLGVRSIRLLSTSQHTYVGLGGFGIEITETEGLEG